MNRSLGIRSLCLLPLPERPLEARRLPELRLEAQPNVVILFIDDHATIDANCDGSTDLITRSISLIQDIHSSYLT